MPSTRSVLLASLLAVGVLAGACMTERTYEGASRPAHRVALLRPDVLPARQIQIDSIDGRALGALSDRAELLPGRHEIEATVSLQIGDRRVNGQHTLTFDAVAGHSYVVGADFYLYGPRIWIEDESDADRVVAQAVTRRGRASVSSGR